MVEDGLYILVVVEIDGACGGVVVDVRCEEHHLVEELLAALKESTSLMCSNVGNAPAKLLKDFIQKDDKLPLLKAAWVEGTAYVGADQMDTLAAIKSKNELIADVVALLQSPAKNVVSALTSGGTKLHGILETLSQKEN